MKTLRDGLRNSHLTLEYSFEEGEEKGTYLFGDKDIYEFMLTKNPALKKLRDALKLEFDR